MLFQFYVTESDFITYKIPSKVLFRDIGNKNISVKFTYCIFYIVIDTFKSKFMCVYVCG